MQDKNSEYLLLLAEALSEGSGRKSKLSAIYHFMEDTAYGDGKGSGEMGVRKGKDITTYNKRGIDTVHFVSVGKVGVSGVIDIRGDISPEEVYRRLHDAVHRTEPLDEEGRKLGLAAGIAVYIKNLLPHVKVIGVEAEGSACMKAALKAGKPVDIGYVSHFADGDCRRPSGACQRRYGPAFSGGHGKDAVRCQDPAVRYHGNHL